MSVLRKRIQAQIAGDIWQREDVLGQMQTHLDVLRRNKELIRGFYFFQVAHEYSSTVHLLIVN